MIFLFVSLLLLALFAALIGMIRILHYRRKIEKGEIDSMPTIRQPHEDGCCGQHETCEKESLLAAVSKGIEYYDDEELDRFKGTAENAYTDAEVEEFRDVLYTMQAEEVAGWVRSLQLRGIAIPEALRDEIILLVDEVRTKAAAAEHHGRNGHTD